MIHIAHFLISESPKAQQTVNARKISENSDEIDQNNQEFLPTQVISASRTKTIIIQPAAEGSGTGKDTSEEVNNHKKQRKHRRLGGVIAAAARRYSNGSTVDSVTSTERTNNSSAVNIPLHNLPSTGPYGK